MVAAAGSTGTANNLERESDMTYLEVKRAIYLVQTVFGLVLVIIGCRTMVAPDILQQVSGWLCFWVGAGLLFFGAITLILWDDMDVIR